MGDDASFHDAFARLGNDLATAERRLIKANAELSSAHEELRALYEALPLGAFKIDNHGTVLQANRRFHALTGLSGPATWFDGAHPLDAERVMRHWQDAVGAALDVRYRHVSPTGLAVDLRVKLVPFHDDVGAPAGFVGIAEDASAQIRAETLAAETERRNAVDSLTAGLAHNLNNILMVIQGNVDQIAAELPDDHPARLNADMTRLANQRAAAITRRLMVYSGQQTSDIRSVPVDAAVARIGAALDTSLPAGVRVTVDPGAGAAATVEVDATLFDETLEELTANARTAVGERGTLQLSSARTDGRDGPMIVITIADNGTGMDGDTRRRAKEPFFTTRAIGQGVGLGLSLADGFARYAGGELSVDSTPGTGTTVTLTLPLHGRA